MEPGESTLNPSEQLLNRFACIVREQFTAYPDFISTVDIPSRYAEELLLRSPGGNLYRLLKFHSMYEDEVVTSISLDVLSPEAPRFYYRYKIGTIRHEIDENEDRQLIQDIKTDASKDVFQRQLATDETLDLLEIDLAQSIPVENTPFQYSE